MTRLYAVANVMSVGVFLCVGLWCLFGGGMKEDFDRFGMSRLRLLTGALEVLGAVGLVAGQFVPELAIVSGGGLAMLMVLGLLTRLRQRDPLVKMVPAALLIIVNGYIAMYAWGATA